MAELAPHPVSIEPAVDMARSSTPGRAMSQLTWTPGYALVMFSMWWLMMIAMMLPAAAPMVLLHASVTRSGLADVDVAGLPASSRRARPATLAFVAGYVATWGAFSLIAVIAQWTLARGGLLSATMSSASRPLGSGLLLAAGAWQLSPLKTVCLRGCRSPMSFLSAHWRPGIGGAVGMGVRHGVLCLGCCWFLMTLLFFAGVMNLIWIAGLALLVLAEKVMPAGIAFARVTGLLLLAWGAWLGIASL